MFSFIAAMKASGDMLRENDFDGVVVVRRAGKNHSQRRSFLVSNDKPQPIRISDWRERLSAGADCAKRERNNLNQTLHGRKNRREKLKGP